MESPSLFISVFLIAVTAVITSASTYFFGIWKSKRDTQQDINSQVKMIINDGLVSLSQDLDKDISDFITNYDNLIRFADSLNRKSKYPKKSLLGMLESDIDDYIDLRGIVFNCLVQINETLLLHSTNVSGFSIYFNDDRSELYKKIVNLRKELNTFYSVFYTIIDIHHDEMYNELTFEEKNPYGLSSKQIEDYTQFLMHTLQSVISETTILKFK